MAPVETMKFTTDRPYSDPEKAARRLMQHAHAFEVVQDGRIYIEKLNGPFLYVDKDTSPPVRRSATTRSPLVRPQPNSQAAMRAAIFFLRASQTVRTSDVVSEHSSICKK